MTHAERLRRDAELAMREGGMYYSGEYLSRIATVAESLEAENAKLRELVRNLLRVVPRDVSGVVIGAHGEHPTYYSFADAMRELGMEKKL